MKRRKKLYGVFGTKRGENFGNFYHFLSTSQHGARQQAIRRGLKPLRIFGETKKKNILR